MYTNSRLWFSKRIVHRASPYPHAAAQVQADEAFLPRAAGLWWSAALVWPGVAECPEDLAEGPGVGCGVRVDSGKYRPGPGNDCQLLLRKERGPQKDSSCLSLLEKDKRIENFKRNFEKKIFMLCSPARTRLLELNLDLCHLKSKRWEVTFLRSWWSLGSQWVFQKPFRGMCGTLMFKMLR